MNAVICDICGKYPAEKFSVTTEYIYNGVDNDPVGLDFDLCSHCQLLVMKHLLAEMKCKPEAEKFIEWFKTWKERISRS